MATDASPPEAPATATGARVGGAALVTTVPPAQSTPAPPPSSADGEPERRRERTRTARLVAIFLGGCATLIAPILSVASRSLTVAGLPLAWVYLFLTWALLIGLTALTVRGRDRGED